MTEIIARNPQGRNFTPGKAEKEQGEGGAYLVARYNKRPWLTLQQEFPLQEKRIKNHRLRRGIFLLPSLFTVANLLCGYYASIAALLGRPEDFDHAAKAIGIAILFDAMDGRIARMTGTNTEFGVQFDSLADVVSFGIAPAILAYAWGYRQLPGVAIGGSRALGENAWIGDIAWLCCLTFLICSAWRLARFNVQEWRRAARRICGYVYPAAAGVVAAIVHACHWLGPLQTQNGRLPGRANGHSRRTDDQRRALLQF
jgi:phosphatidylserine synthase